MVSEAEIQKLIATTAKDIEQKYGSIQRFEDFSGETVERFVRRFVASEENKNKSIPVKTSVDGEFATLSYQGLLDLLNQYEHGYKIRGGVSDSVIRRSEKEIGYTFPETFREYLRVFGGMNIGDSHEVGFGEEATTEELLWITRFCRENYGLPEGYLCLSYDHDFSYTTCIDLQSNRGDDAPVMWYLFDEQSFDGIESINYDIYFRNEMKAIITVARNA